MIDPMAYSMREALPNRPRIPTPMPPKQAHPKLQPHQLPQPTPITLNLRNPNNRVHNLPPNRQHNNRITHKTSSNADKLRSQDVHACPALACIGRGCPAGYFLGDWADGGYCCLVEVGCLRVVGIGCVCLSGFWGVFVAESLVYEVE